MPRTVRFEVTSDTSLFTPLQAQPRALIWLMMNGWAKWARAHLVSFPTLVRDHRVGLVVVGIHLEYVEPFGFLDADAFEVEVRVAARKGGAVFDLAFEYIGAGRTFARSHGATRTVLLGDDASMAAVPGKLPAALMARFQPDEIVEGSPTRVVPGLIKALEASGPPLAAGTRPFLIHRHSCEVADQWSFIDVPGIAGEGREHLALGDGTRVPALRKGLSRPLRSIDVEMGHPFYSFESGTLESNAYLENDGITYLHRLRSSDKVHATVIERL